MSNLPDDQMTAHSGKAVGLEFVRSGGDSVTPQTENLGGEQSSPSAQVGQLTRSDLERVALGLDQVIRATLDAVDALPENASASDLKRAVAPLIINPWPAPPAVVERLRQLIASTPATLEPSQDV